MRITAIFLFLMGFAAPVWGSETKPKFIASVFPIYEMALRIAGERWEPILAIPPGRSDHFHDLSPKELKSWVGAKLLVRAGAGLDEWVVSMAKKAAPRGNAPQDLILVQGSDPHFWLDPVLVKEAVLKIRDALGAIDPAGKEFYEKNTQAFVKSLDLLHEDLRKKTLSWKTRNLITHHNSLGHLARRYGFTILGVVEKQHDREPSAKEMGELIALAKKSGRVALILEPQVEKGPIQTIAKATGYPVAMIDIVGGTPGKRTYESLMLNCFSELEKVLK